MRSLRLSYAIPLAAAVAATVILITRKRRRRGNDASENEIRFGNDEVNRTLLERLRCNDSTLRELSLCFPSPYTVSTSVERKVFVQQYILPAIEAIGTNTFLERLDAEKEELDGIGHTSVHPKRHQHLHTLVVSGASVDDITAIAEALPFNMKLKTLTLCQWRISSAGGTLVFAGAFHRNQTLKTLRILCGTTIPGNVAALVVEALPRDHNLEAISIRGRPPTMAWVDDNSAERIVNALCRTNLKFLSFTGNNLISKVGAERIVKILKNNDNCFNKIEFFDNEQVSDWHNEIRLEIEKNTWAKRFLKISDTRTQEVLLPFALKRAEKVDNERPSKAPDMVLYLVKEKCGLFGSFDSAANKRKLLREKQKLKDFFCRWCW